MSAGRSRTENRLGIARILVIDDDALLRRALRAVLEVAGYDVIEAADGAAGLRLQREQGADLILVDLVMPELDGLEFIRKLRADLPQAKIIAMSGGGPTGRADLLGVAAALGASRTLRKPFEPRDLLTAIQELLGER
jgi:CheY-like chemotaxis protein